MVEPEGIDNRLIGLLVVVGAILVVFLVLVSQAIFYSVENADDAEKRLLNTGVYAREIQATQREELLQYKWRDKDNQRVTIPIERAMSLVVAEHAKGE